MPTAAGLPLPSLSRGRFPWALDTQSGEVLSDEIIAYTDEALYDALDLRILFTERSGGVSVGPFESLDFGAPNVLDEKEGAAYRQGSNDNADYRNRVDFNKGALARALGLLNKIDCPLVCPKQVHGDCIVSVQEHFEATPASEQASGGCDAVLVSCTDVAALLRFADCLPLILVAPTGAFAVVHCGWRGVVAHLAHKSAKQLAAQAHCAPEALNAYIGPYIHKECFEVGSETAQVFVNEFNEHVVSAASGELEPRFLVDMGAAVVHDLLLAGLLSERITDINVCTVCENDRFFSYRAQDGICGRHGAFACRSAHIL